MLPANPFMQLVPGRVAEALGRLRGRVWSGATPVAVAHSEPSIAHLTWQQAQSLPLTSVGDSFCWGQLWDQMWFRLELPGGAGGRYLHWHDQGESTLYVDGVPYYGFDGPHQYCRLPAGCRTVWIESMCSDPGLVAGQGCRCHGAVLLDRDDAAWQANCDLQLLYDLLAEEHKALFPPGSIYGGGFGYIPPVERSSVLFRRMLRRLDEAISAFDRDGLPALQQALDGIFAEFRTDPLALRCVLTGHAHIDLVWLWPEKAGTFKCTHTFASMTRLMDLYPEFRFNFTQPAGYQAVAQRAPGLLERIKSLIAAGQWEATGASYVESDTQLACGEALARGLVIGQQHYARLRGGEPAKVLWLPDVFGYTACLPQIMKQTGVDYFFTTKLTWCSVNRFPFSSFRWQGHDGSEVIAHVTQDFGYNGMTSPSELKAGALGYRQSDVHDAFLAPTGFGDGGGGVTEVMCERARRLADLTSMPRTQWGLIEDYFADLATVGEQLPTWRGELYLEYHRGVMTTHSHVKAAFRGLERALQAHEAARCALGGQPVDAHPWERLVFAQFHDYIPGSSIHEVYDEGAAELNQLAETALGDAVAELGTTDEPAWFNPLPLPRIWQGRELPPLSGAPVSSLTPIAAAPVQTGLDCLDNGVVRAEFDAAGRVTALGVRGQQVALAAPLGDLAVYPDHPHNYAAWDIDRSTLANGHFIEPAAVGSIEDGSATCGVLRFERRLTEGSRVVVRYRLEAGSPVLEMAYDVDWQDHHALLKAHFPTAYQGVNARFGHPFGSVLRGQQPGKERDEAQWEVCASRWVAVCDDTELAGLMLITEAKYGFTCHQGNLQLSLVRSAAITNEGLHQAIRHTQADHPVSDIGRHHIRLAIGHYSALNPRAEQPAALADLLFTPPLAYAGPAVSTAFRGLHGGDSLLPSWAQPLGDGRWVLRLHETLGRRGTARLELAEGYTARAVDLLGRPVERLVTDEVAFAPYELISLLIEPSA